MNTGVSTVPWASVSLPRRAAPHRAVTWNSIAAILAAVTPPSNEFGPTNGPSSVRSVGADSSARGVRVTLQEHRITVTIEAVALADRVRVGSANRRVAGKRGHQHQQRR